MNKHVRTGVLLASAGALSLTALLWGMRDTQPVEIAQSDAPGLPEIERAPTAGAALATALAAPSPSELELAPAPASDEVEPAALPAERTARGQDYGLSRDLQRQLDRYYESAADTAEHEDSLLELALSNEPGVLYFLLDELHGAKPEERSSIIEAAIQYGSREIIPELRHMAETAATPQEQQALNEAADYLALPSLTEIRNGTWKPQAADAAH